jgi:hypothetical protein
MNEKDIYIKESYEYISYIKNDLAILDDNPGDKTALHDILRCSHGLKGNSMQMGFFIVAYFSHIINDMVRDIEEGRTKPTEENIAFISDFLGSLEKIMSFSAKKKKYEISRQLFKKLDKLMYKEFNKPMKKDVKGIYEEEVSSRLNKIDILVKHLDKKFSPEIIKNIIDELHALEGIFLQAGFLKNSSICLIIKDIMYKILEDKKIEPESVSVIKNSVERLRMSLKLLKGG